MKIRLIDKYQTHFTNWTWNNAETAYFCVNFDFMSQTLLFELA